MFGLLKRLSFSSVILSQFLGALNDNALRQTYLLLVVGMGTAERQAEATVLFALPFLLFSPLAGQLADRFSKRTVFVITKLAELLVMVLAAYALWVDSLGLLLLSILLMASQSVFFSPAKYGILPEILEYEQLSHGNGIIQMTTNIAILCGTALAGVLLESGGRIWTGFVLVFFGLVGWSATFFIEEVPPASEELNFDYNPLKRTAQNFSWIRQDSLMLLAVGGFVFSWLLATVLMLNVNVFGLQTLGVGETLTSLLFVALALGLGTGGAFAGWLSGEKIEYGLIIPGLLGLTVGLLTLWGLVGGFYLSYFWMYLTGVSSGIFLIPLQSALQDRPPEEQKGEGLATANIVTFTGVIAGTALYVILIQDLNLSATTLMFYMAVGSFSLAILLIFALPWLFKRFVTCLLSALFFRIQVRGKENIPHRGPALIKVESLTSLQMLKLACCVPLPLVVAGKISSNSGPLVQLLARLLSVAPSSAIKRNFNRPEASELKNLTGSSSVLCLAGENFDCKSISKKLNEDCRVIRAEIKNLTGYRSEWRDFLINCFGDIALPVEIVFSSCGGS